MRDSDRWKETERDHASIVVQFWQQMALVFIASVVQKGTSGFMRSASWFLDAIGIMDKQTFMERYTTTIFSTIYVPFQIGIPTKNYSLWGQLSVCAHECQHVAQGNRDGVNAFNLRYLMDSGARAAYEAEALTAQMELEYWRWGEVPEDRPERRSRILEHYGCSEKDIEWVRVYLEQTRSTIMQGGIITAAGLRATYLLDKLLSEGCDEVPKEAS